MALNRTSTRSDLRPHVVEPQDQDETRQHGPVRIVADGQARGGRITGHMECRVQEGMPPCGIHTLQFQRDGRQDGTAHQAEKEELQHRVVQRTERAGHERDVQQAEMHRCEDHEDDREHGNERGMEIAHGQVVGGEPARRAYAESVVDGIERRHAGRPETQESEGEDGQIHPRDTDLFARV